MWSNLYFYFNIQEDRFVYQYLSIETVTKVLLNTGCLEQTALQTFKNKEDFPWIEVSIANSANGNFAITTEQIEIVNLISIVCSKKDTNNEEIYKDLLLKIAYQLNWKLFLEEDDKGNEQLEIYYPKLRYDFELDIKPENRYLPILNKIEDNYLKTASFEELESKFTNEKQKEYIRIHQQELLEFTKKREEIKLLSLGISHAYANIELPKVYDIVFDINDTTKFWKTKTIVRYAFNYRTLFHTDLWRGHHSHCFIEIVGDIPPIFEKLTTQENSQFKIGLTTQYDWEFVNPFLTKSNNLKK